MIHAPVVLFVYNRPDHLKATLASLKLNAGAEDTILYIFAEGPKPNAEKSVIDKIKQVRKIIHEISGFKEVIISESETNIGCATSMTTGISKVVNLHGRVIILEDDILTHPDFLQFCNKGLELYENEEQVKQIGGFMFPSNSELPNVFFSKAVFCWGWATWKRAWDEMSMNAEKYLQEIKERKLEKEFDLNGAYPYLSSLEKQVSGKIDAWDICWYSTIFLKDGLSVYPGKSMTKNIGMDGSGTHFKSNVQNPIINFQVSGTRPKDFPQKIEFNEDIDKIVYRAVHNWISLPGKNKIIGKLGLLLNKIKKLKNTN
ncbi:MAG: glycosyltransferase family 2 protein [Bacteroidia bacterium]|nr:glycosyltransferase family 2 protein [Bacteroidia bacterium]